MAARENGPIKPHPSVAMLRETMHRLFAGARGGGAPLRGGLRPDALRRIERVIDAWLDQRSSFPKVADLASEARLSASHFISVFRETTGTTPYQYLVARRRQRAMALLRQAKLSVAEVGDRLGFSSPAHFIAAFRQRFGTSPGEYRRAILDPDMLGRASPR